MDPSTSSLAVRIRQGWLVALVALLLIGAVSQTAAFSDTAPDPTDVAPDTLCLWRTVAVLYDVETTSGFASASEAVEALVSRVGEILPPFQVVPMDDPLHVMLLDEQDRPLGHADLLSVPDGGVVAHELAICSEVLS